MKQFTHIDAQGHAVMVDVSEKKITRREASASGRIRMSDACFMRIHDGSIPKGDVLAAARIAGIMAAKRTQDLIPLCHSLALENSQLHFVAHPETYEIEAVCTVGCAGKTGVEMEALTGVSVALLTIYDMCKAIDKRMVIGDIHLEKKTGGKSGDFTF